jgi:hypothetical protein
MNTTNKRTAIIAAGAAISLLALSPLPLIVSIIALKSMY